jgi:hypothetical protein
MSTEPITRWVPAMGQWEFNEPGRAVYLGPQPGQDRPFGICLSRPFGICLSKSRFSEGEVRVTVQMCPLCTQIFRGDCYWGIAGITLNITP